MSYSLALPAVTGIFLVAMCAGPSAAQDAGRDPMAGWAIQAVRLDDIPAPSDNPLTRGKAALGERLFYEPLLSASNTMRCATCHVPEYGFSEVERRAAEGATMPAPRRAPALNNLARHPALMWDGRSPSLEDQALLPLRAHHEMNQPVDELLTELDAAGYAPLFREVFGDSVGLSEATLAMALAAYERTIVSYDAPFDRYMAGDTGALSPAQRRGKALFETRAGCITCHDGPDFTDYGFHNIGVDTLDAGRFAQVPLPSMKYAFKTPGLRDAARRSSFFHDGSAATLHDVMAFYNRGGRFDPLEVPNVAIEPLGLSEAEIDDLVAFIEALVGTRVGIPLQQAESVVIGHSDAELPGPGGP
ncbi:MAG: cytochrome c peroxidase [Rhodothermales bacterium]